MVKVRTVQADDFVPSDLAKGKKNVTVAEWGQQEWELGLQAGVIKGHKEVIAWLEKKAAGLFIARNQDAPLLLLLVDSLRKELEIQ